MQEIGVSENEELDEKAEKLTKYKEAVLVVQNNEKVIRWRKKGISSIAFRKGKILHKLKNSKKFKEMIKYQIKTSN